MKDSKAWLRYTVLGDMLMIMEALKRLMSRNGNNQSPLDGYETAFHDQERRMQVIREMMIEERTKAEQED